MLGKFKESLPARIMSINVQCFTSLALQLMSWFSVVLQASGCGDGELLAMALVEGQEYVKNARQALDADPATTVKAVAELRNSTVDKDFDSSLVHLCPRVRHLGSVVLPRVDMVVLRFLFELRSCTSLCQFVVVVSSPCSHVFCCSPFAWFRYSTNTVFVLRLEIQLDCDLECR